MSGRLLYTLLLGAILLPGIQNIIGLFKVSPLEQTDNTAVEPKFSIPAYLNLTYQDSFNLYCEKGFGLRPWFIRLVNEVNYDLFRYTTAPGVIVGEDDFLFIDSYVENYLGKNYVGDDKIKHTSEKIKKVQDYLGAKGKTLLIVFAPGKATYHADLLPQKYLRQKKDKSNYSVYAQTFREQGINFIDLNAYFLNQKDKLKYPLYSSFGTHWSYYGLTLGVDSIIRYIENKRNQDLPEIAFEVEEVDTIRHPDYDVAQLLNLARELPHNKMPYPRYSYHSDGKTKPSALVIGDSYWHCVVGADIPSNIFKEDVYWSYYKDVYYRNAIQPIKASKINILEEIEKRDVIMIMATEATLSLFPYGFIEKLYAVGCEGKHEGVYSYIEEIKADKNWLDMIKKDCETRNLPLDSMIEANAIYMVNSQGK